MANTEMALECLRQTWHVSKAEGSLFPCPFLQPWRCSATRETMKDSGWLFAQVTLGTGAFYPPPLWGYENWNLITVGDHLNRSDRVKKSQRRWASKQLHMKGTFHRVFASRNLRLSKPGRSQITLTIQTYQSLRKDQEKLWRCQRWSQLWRKRCIMEKQDGLKSERHKGENCYLIK